MSSKISKKNKLKIVPDKLANPAGYLGTLKDDGFKEKNGKIFKEKTQEQYKEIWKEFIDNESAEYCDFMGYSLEDITCVGYKRFIDAHDWRTKEDIKKWRTDKAHIVPCAECKNDFAIYEIDMGICQECKKKYNLTKFSAFTSSLNDGEFTASDAIDKFYIDKGFRNQFLK